MCRARQSPARRDRTMLRTTLLILLSTHVCTPYSTDRPSFADRLDKIYEKLERFNINGQTLEPSPEEKLYAKLDILNSLSPDVEKLDFSEDDEELLSTMQAMGLSAEQINGVVKDLQGKRDDDESRERMDEYADGDWNDEFQDLSDSILADSDYAMDAKEDWDSDDETDLALSTSKPVAGITPSALRIDSAAKTIKTVVSAVDPIAATNERPKILDDSLLTPAEKIAVRNAAAVNMGRTLRSAKCHVPQPRWLSVRQLAPSADTAYMPSCVQLHRCAPDAGCCYKEGDVCAPIDGTHVVIPLYLRKANGAMNVARMEFFNHTACACVSRDTLQTTIRTLRSETKSIDSGETRNDSLGDRQNDWRPTEEPKLDAGSTAPPELRRCTCPRLFLANLPESGPCSCICDWPDATRRRDCSSFARGKEHFGMRDRVCVANGDCTPPTCEFGAYDRNRGQCPLRRFRRIRYHRGRHQLEKTIVV